MSNYCRIFWLCPDCIKTVINCGVVGQCGVCNVCYKDTYSDIYRYCRDCAERLNVCNVCGVKKDTRI